jgi:hypothetical protein
MRDPSQIAPEVQSYRPYGTITENWHTRREPITQDYPGPPVSGIPYALESISECGPGRCSVCGGVKNIRREVAVKVPDVDCRPGGSYTGAKYRSVATKVCADCLHARTDGAVISLPTNHEIVVMSSDPDTIGKW